MTMQISNSKPKTIVSNMTVFLFCVAISFVFLSICSQNSFLFTFNTNTDLNWYIAMGNGLVDGRVPYKDLFEQKGPLIYLVFGFICLFKNPFILTFILEIICISAYLYLSFKIANRYLSRFASLIAVTILGFISISSPYNLVGGGTVEEFCLPFLTYIFICFLDLIENKTQFTVVRSILIGVSVAVMFWIKFTSLVGVFIILLIWLIINLKNKNFKHMFISIGFMFLGFIIVTFFTLIYYIINHALGDMLWAYFYMNIFVYNSKYINMFVNLFKMFAYDYICMCLCLIGLILYSKKFGKTAWLYFAVFAFNIIVLMMQNCHIYYFVVLYPFACIGLSLICNKLAKIRCNNLAKIISIIISISIGVAYCCCLCPTASEIGRSENSYAQILVAKDIKIYALENGIENPTLFCYKMSDCSYYNSANITPNLKFYIQNNYTEEAFPLMYEEFRLNITEQRTDFLIVKKGDYIRENSFITQYYTYLAEYSVEQFDNMFVGSMGTVVLLVKSN